MNVAYILIDEKTELQNIRVFSLSTAERLIRQCIEYGFSEIFLLSENQELIRKYLSYKDVKTSLIRDLPRLIEGKQRDLQFHLMTSDLIIDDRLIRSFMKDKANIIVASGKDDSVMAQMDYETMAALIATCGDSCDGKTLKKNIAVFAMEGKLAVKKTEAYETYIHDLRTSHVPYLFSANQESDLRQVENKIYEVNYKAVLDFIAIYIYKYPVREIVRFLCRFPLVTPNFVTALSVICSFAVPALYITGYLGWAIIAGWAMFIFDEIDGKLARLTVRLSKVAGIIEHGTSAPAIFLWFASLGWFFSGGDIFNPSILSNWACWTLLLMYWVDKGVNALYRMRYSPREIYNHAWIDAKFHLIACRRAIIHLIMTAGVLAGKPLEAFYFMAFWMIFSFAFHVIRYVWISLTEKPTRTPDSNN